MPPKRISHIKWQRHEGIMRIFKISQETITYEEAIKTNLDIAEKMVKDKAKQNGYTIKAFHGSPNSNLSTISKMNTAFGLFFSPDEDTAGYYTGNAGKTYSVYIKANKILDLSDDENRYKFFTECFGGNNKKMMMEDRYGDYTEVDNEELIKRLKMQIKEQGFSKLIAYDERIGKEIEDDEWINNGFFDISGMLNYLYFDNDDIVGFLKENANEYLNGLREIDIDVKYVEDSYGTQDFYLQKYQNDVMREANAQKYDMVIFDDPSYTGASLSYVVFNSNNIKSADVITYDDNSNIIPLEKRFDENKSNINY